LRKAQIPLQTQSTRIQVDVSCPVNVHIALDRLNTTSGVEWVENAARYVIS